MHFSYQLVIARFLPSTVGTKKMTNSKLLDWPSSHPYTPRAREFHIPAASSVLRPPHHLPQWRNPAKQLTSWAWGCWNLPFFTGFHTCWVVLMYSLSSLSHYLQGLAMVYELVVEPIQLKNMLKSKWVHLPQKGVKIKNVWVATT